MLAENTIWGFAQVYFPIGVSIFKTMTTFQKCGTQDLDFDRTFRPVTIFWAAIMGYKILPALPETVLCFLVGTSTYPYKGF